MNTNSKDKNHISKTTCAIVVLLVAILFFAAGFITSRIICTQDSTSKSVKNTQSFSDKDIELTDKDKYSPYMDKNLIDPDKDDIEEPTSDASTPDISEDKSDIDDFVSGLMEKMTLSEKIYQLMFVRPEAITGVGTVTAAGKTTEESLRKYPVGGIVYFADNLIDRKQTTEMIKNTQSYSAIPLFIGVDEEGGNVSRLGSNPKMGTTKHPPMEQIGKENDAKKAYEVGATLAKDLKSLGFNVDFAPCADVLVNKDNTEIGSRSFSSDPNVASQMVGEVVSGLEDNNVSATLKHFPGHGSTHINSHKSRSESERSIDQLRQCEFLPFKKGIEKNVDFIMISHMSLVNATTEKCPSSLSKEVITDMLIEELGYKGIIITDSLEMGAITDEYGTGNASVKALNAGADMLLMPPDAAKAHSTIMNAVTEGKISEERIDLSVRKILTLKYEKELISKKQV